MGDDNLVEAALGALEGFNAVFLPFQREKFKSDLLLKEKQKELELEQPFKLEQIRERPRGTSILNAETGEITSSNNPLKVFEPKKKNDTPEQIEENAAAKEEGIQKVRQKFGVSSKNKKKIPDLSPQQQRQINDLEALKGDVEQIFQLSNNVDIGIMGGIEKLGSKIPVVGASAFPNTSQYEDSLIATGANITKAFTGSSRPSNVLIEAETKQLPRPEDSMKVKEEKKFRMFQRINNRINLIKSGVLESDQNQSSVGLGVSQQQNSSTDEIINKYTNPR